MKKVVVFKPTVIVDDGNIEGILRDLREMLAGKLVSANVQLVEGGLRPYPKLRLCLIPEKAIGVMRPSERIVVTDSSVLWLSFIGQTPFMFETADKVEVSWPTAQTVILTNLNRPQYPDPFTQIAFNVLAA